MINTFNRKGRIGIRWLEERQKFLITGNYYGRDYFSPQKGVCPFREPVGQRPPYTKQGQRATKQEESNVNKPLLKTTSHCPLQSEWGKRSKW